MNLPVFTDTEAETSVELDEPMFNQTNATKSIFNITLNDDLDDKGNHAFKSYEERLRGEIKQWGAIWRESAQKLKEFKSKPHTIIDTSILSAENRTHLEKAPDLQRFLRESIDFRQKAYIFLKKYYPDFQDVQNNLIEVWEYHRFVVGEAEISKNLANLSLEKFKN